MALEGVDDWYLFDCNADQRLTLDEILQPLVDFALSCPGLLGHLGNTSGNTSGDLGNPGRRSLGHLGSLGNPGDAILGVDVSALPGQVTWVGGDPGAWHDDTHWHGEMASAVFVREQSALFIGEGAKLFIGPAGETVSVESGDRLCIGADCPVSLPLAEAAAAYFSSIFHHHSLVQGHPGYYTPADVHAHGSHLSEAHRASIRQCHFAAAQGQAAETSVLFLGGSPDDAPEEYQHDFCSTFSPLCKVRKG